MNTSTQNIPDVDESSVGALKYYCESRGGMCQGCRYSMDKLVKNYFGNPCIFSSKPINWRG